MAEDTPDNQGDTPDPNGSGSAYDGSDAEAGQAAERALNDAQHAADQLDEATRAGGSGSAAGNAGSSAGAQQGAASDVTGGEGEGDPPNLDLPNFQRVMEDVDASGIEMLRDVELNVKIELGRTHMLVEDVLGLSDGSVVELNKLAGDPVDVYVNDRLVARGEVLVLSENFCVRINEIVADVAEEIAGEDADTATEEVTAGAGANGNAGSGANGDSQAGGSGSPGE